MSWQCQGRIKGAPCGAVRGDDKITPSLDPTLGLARCWKCSGGRLAPHRRLPDVEDGQGQARHSDPATSKEAAARVRTGSAKAALLEAHAGHPDGLTDEEAAHLAGLKLTSEYATRCSELMRAGFLRDTGQSRVGVSGMRREVRVITEAGWRAIRP